jgi:hypothetical protein
VVATLPRGLLPVRQTGHQRGRPAPGVRRRGGRDDPRRGLHAGVPLRPGEHAGSGGPGGGDSAREARRNSQDYGVPCRPVRPEPCLH